MTAPMLDDAVFDLPEFALVCCICEGRNPAKWFVWHTCGCIDPMCDYHKTALLEWIADREVTHNPCGSWHYVTVEKVTPL